MSAKVELSQFTKNCKQAVAQRTMNSNPFEPPTYVGQPKRGIRSKALRIAFRCIAGLLVFGSFWTAKLAWYFLNQDHLHIWPTEGIICEVELAGVGGFTNDQLIVVAIAMTLLMWVVAITLLLLSRRSHRHLR